MSYLLSKILLIVDTEALKTWGCSKLRFGQHLRAQDHPELDDRGGICDGVCGDEDKPWTHRHALSNESYAICTTDMASSPSCWGQEKTKPGGTQERELCNRRQCYKSYIRTQYKAWAYEAVGRRAECHADRRRGCCEQEPDRPSSTHAPSPSAYKRGTSGRSYWLLVADEGPFQVVHYTKHETLQS